MNIILPCQNLKEKDLRIENGILYLGYGYSFQNVMYNLTYFMKGKNYCYYCKRTIPRNKITMDHMYPRSTGGPTIPQNLIPSCKRCNSEKSDMTFAQYQTYLNLSSFSERKSYLSTITSLKEGIKNMGMFEIPNEWITPVKTSEIHTNIDFANISETKFQKAKSYYKTYHGFQVPMILDRNLYSLDGFYVLFVAKSSDISYVPAIVLDNVEIRIGRN